MGTSNPKVIVLEEGMVVKLISKEEYRKIVVSDLDNVMVSDMFDGEFTLIGSWEDGQLRSKELPCWRICPYMVKEVVSRKLKGIDGAYDGPEVESGTEDCSSIFDNNGYIVTPKVDKGSHYRYMYNGVKIDPYRVCKIYGIKGGPHEHMTKKLLRGEDKGHSVEDLIKELQCCLDRWKEMIKEDNDETR